jgi:hypothetical protein
MIYLTEEMQKKLNIYTKNNQKYTKCLVRTTEIALNGRPEELVRQMFIHCLIQDSRSLSDKIYIKVEANNHDIEIYIKEKNHNFKPHKAPLIIVEVKREDASLQNHHNQIKRYLKNARYDIGILYNCHEVILFNKISEDFKGEHLRNFKEVEELILKESIIVDYNLLEFEKAQNGNVASFRYLVDKYGKYATNTIVFKLKNEPSELKGYFFKVKGNKIQYDPCGPFANKQQCFDSQDFEKLLSIKH